MSKTATLEIEGKKYEFPIIVGTENEIAIDINKLRDLTSVITMDPGYKNSGSCLSEITFLDGEEGEKISCNFGKQIRVFLPPRDSAFGYILEVKSSREYDSTLFEFLFYDVVDDAEYGYKIKRPAKKPTTKT
mgnify:CR=1 FL=1